jgi:hypothetical protein
MAIAYEIFAAPVKCGRKGREKLTRIPQWKVSEGQTWSSEDTREYRFKVGFYSWHKDPMT